MIAVCWKWVGGDGDPRWAGVSESDRAALEIGLRLATATADAEGVTVVSVGGHGAEVVLREALATGARRAVRVDAPDGLASATVASSIAAVAADCDWVVTGDASPDRGSGSVPAFLAAELGAAQALGLVGIDVDGEAASGATVRATRRLDGGRRELLEVTAPAVLSVEGAVARLRRASLSAQLVARSAPIEVVDGPRGPLEPVGVVHAYRPRARALAAPRGDALERVRRLTDAGHQRTTHELVTLDPAAAADRILDALDEWGYGRG